jgi:GTP-binding protein EngB required for normal cell division
MQADDSCQRYLKEYLMELQSKCFPISSTKELVGRVNEAASRFHIVSLKRRIEACESILKENPLIDIAILGQFKAGKSSFINSLLGREILPVGVIPVTTVITRLQYGPQERSMITYIDGTRSEIGIEELGKFISEAQNPSNSKNVDIVDIELPALEAYPGLRLVDTPGLGSVFKYHKEVSENWLPEVGAAVLAISSDRPLSEHDLNLIADLSHHTPMIIILLTKADLLTPDQLNEVVQFFQQTLKRTLNREYPIFLYSTRPGMEIFKHRIETEFLTGLSKNRDLEFNRILNYKTQSLLTSCLTYLNIAMKTSVETDQDREALRSQILNEKVCYEQIREEIYVITRECQRQTRTLLANHLDKFKNPLTEKLKADLSGEMPSWKGNLWKLTRRYEAWVIEHMEEEIRHISKTENSHFYGTLNKAHNSLTRYLETFRMMLNDNIDKVLGIKLAETDWKIEVTEPDKPDIGVLYTFDFKLDLLWFLIPMFIFRRFFEQHFLKAIPWVTEVNISRLITQRETRINKAIDGMRKQAEDYIKDELSTIDALLSQPRGTTGEILYMMADMKEFIIEPHTDAQSTFLRASEQGQV